MRRLRLVSFLATVTVISLALASLVGLVVQPGTTPYNFTTFLITLVTVVAAIAVLVGLVNLVGVHLGRFVRAERGWPYSIVVLVAMLAVIVLRILDGAGVWSGDLEDESISTRVFEAVQVSLESALAALLVFFLVYAAYRLMRHEVSIWNAIFLLSLIVVLIGWIPSSRLIDFSYLRNWFVEVPVSAGARGILIGIGLGTLMVGVRVLTGQDRAIRG